MPLKWHEWLFLWSAASYLSVPTEESLNAVACVAARKTSSTVCTPTFLFCSEHLQLEISELFRKALVFSLSIFFRQRIMYYICLLGNQEKWKRTLFGTCLSFLSFVIHQRGKKKQTSLKTEYYWSLLCIITLHLVSLLLAVSALS